MYQMNPLYPLNLYNVTCPLYLNKEERKESCLVKRNVEATPASESFQENHLNNLLQSRLLTTPVHQNQCNAYFSNSNTLQCPSAVRKWPLQMIALCIIPVLLSRHIKEFTDLHIEASASGCSDLLLCHGSYPFFNTVFPRDTTDRVTRRMSLLSLCKGLRIQGSGLFFKDFCYEQSPMPSSITFLFIGIFFYYNFVT